MPKLGLETLSDGLLSQMDNLQVLNLSYNNIRTIECLPPCLRELYITGNQIEEINLREEIPSMLHFGAAYN